MRETETVKVTDPRHPLYGNTLSLISIEQRQDVGHCCVVDVGGGSTRYIPVAVTDQALERVHVSPIPLSLKAIQQLLNTFQRIVEGDQDEELTTATGGRVPATTATRPSLVPSDTTPTTDPQPETGTRLSGLAPTVEHHNGESS